MYRVYKPFTQWKGVPELVNMEVGLRILTINEQLKISRVLATESAVSLLTAMKLELLAYAIQSIDGIAIVTTESFKEYKKDNKISDDSFTEHEYIVNKLRTFTEQVINALYFSYEELQNTYVEKLRGSSLPEELVVSSSNTSASAADIQGTDADAKNNT